MADMGLGNLGTGDTVFKRKFRWTLEFLAVCNIPGNNIDASYVKAAKRPNLTIEQTEINYLNGKMWIPGKGTPDELTVTYFDVASKDGATTISRLFSWLATVYNFTDSKRLTQSSAQNKPGGYNAKAGILRMLDGCGGVIDGFVYVNPWPTAINFGELAYTDNDECTIDLTCRYSNFEYFSGSDQCSKGFQPYCAGCDRDGSAPLYGSKSLNSVISGISKNK